MEGLTTRRFVISVLISAVVMLLLSFFWHGLVLNDFKNIQYNFSLFIGLAILAYLIISVVINGIIYYIKPGESLFGKPLLAGVAFGFFIYLVVFVMGISYHPRGLEHVVIDFCWQMAEQGIGAITVAFCYRVYHRMDLAGED